MADYNDPNNLDKRMNQDRIERETKATASSGMWIAGVLIILAIIIGLYMLNRPVVAPVVDNTTPATTTTTDQTTGAVTTTPAEGTTTTTTTQPAQ